MQVSGIQAWAQAATVHNLTVQGIHTYYVTVGSLDILSHNQNCEISLGELPKDRDRRTAGILDVGNDQLPMVSGPGGQAEDLPGMPGVRRANASHVETHAAAFLRMNPGLQRAVLYIDYPTGTCPTCRNSLPSMLPSGFQLLVRSPKGQERFWGNSD